MTETDQDIAEFRRKNGLYSIEEVAKFFGISPATLENWRQARKGPAYTKIGRRVFYQDADLKSYVESARVTTHSTPAHDQSA